MIAGNHDHYGSVKAQIDYTQLSSKWTFPNFYYTIKTELRNGIKAVFIMIDTIKLCTKEPDDFADKLFDFLSKDQQEPEATPEEAQQQLNWIEQQLFQNQK